MSKSSDKEYVQSPCVSICALNDENICIGCYRSGDEISDWGSMSSEERKAVLRRVYEREKAAYRWN